MPLIHASKLPASFNDKLWVDSGGLMAYANDAVDNWRQAAGYVDKILRGAKPGDLPVQLPTTFALTVNRRTLQAQDLKLPPQVLEQVTGWVD